MAAKPAKFVLNFQALTEVQQAVAMGVLEFGKAIAADAASHVAVSEDPRYGHIKSSWGVAAYAFGKKVGNASADDSATAKPRALRTGKETILGIVGFDFPARFHEVGTSDTPARPFLAPAAQRVSGSAPEIIAAGAKPHWPRPG
jgi:hypothetical protein